MTPAAQTYAEPISISSDLLNWLPESHGGSVVEEAHWRRAYSSWRRAEQFITADTASHDDQADFIANLRKSLTRRLKLIDALYHLRSSLKVGNKRHALDLLASVGLIRPILLRALLDLRNSIEYNDADPPGVGRCRELVDAVWYFLRSTDVFVSVVRDNFFLTPPDATTPLSESHTNCNSSLAFLPRSGDGYQSTSSRM